MDDEAPLIMRIRVKLFAILKDAAGTGELALELPPDATVESARQALAAHVPSLGKYLPRVAFAVNREYVKPDTRLRPHDELALIPPVSGG
jgi:molybdopterin converting factor subunit 1